MQMRHAGAKASVVGAARQGNLQLCLRRVWLYGREEGAAVAETGSVVEILRNLLRSFFRTQSPREAQFHKVQPAPTPKVLLRKLKKEPGTGMR